MEKIRRLFRKIVIPDELIFLDDILKILAENPMKTTDFNSLFNSVCREDTTFSGLEMKWYKSFVPANENESKAFLQSAIMYLKSMDLIVYSPEFTSQITFEGLVLVRKKGLEHKEWIDFIKTTLQIVAWTIVVATFIVNLYLISCRP